MGKDQYLQGKLAIVTGASKPNGIGAATAIALAEHGANVSVSLQGFLYVWLGRQRPFLATCFILPLSNSAILFDHSLLPRHLHASPYWNTVHFYFPWLSVATAYINIYEHYPQLKEIQSETLQQSGLLGCLTNIDRLQSITARTPPLQRRLSSTSNHLEWKRCVPSKSAVCSKLMIHRLPSRAIRDQKHLDKILSKQSSRPSIQKRST